ncbi:MAG TPA: RNA polymerase sigma factor [Rhizomicrobium sp.]|nr:RNA polymerase sigma factor [Rhizomicrobium sp.]
MIETPETGRENSGLHGAGAAMTVSDADIWFVREVLPLEATLMQFLRRNCRDKADIPDLCQDIYVRVYEAALERPPERPKAFVLATARNLLINRMRRDQIVRIDAVADLEATNIALEEPGPERVVLARDTLRRLQLALDRLPARCREAVILKKIEGLPAREIAMRMGIAENTVNRHLTEGMLVLADCLYGEEATP